MDVEPQYPVDAATHDAMQDGAGGGGAPDATNAANLDEYMRESGGVKKSRGGRGPGGERLKVRAVIVKRPSAPPGGGRGGRGRGSSGGAPRKVSTRRDPVVAARETKHRSRVRLVPSDPSRFSHDRSRSLLPPRASSRTDLPFDPLLTVVTYSSASASACTSARTASWPCTSTARM